MTATRRRLHFWASVALILGVAPIFPCPAGRWCRDDQRMSRAQQDRQVAQPIDIGRVQLVDALLEQILGLRRSRSGAIERSLVAAKQRRMAWVSTAESLRVWKR